MEEPTTPTRPAVSRADRVTVRPAQPPDADPLLALANRCSESTLYRRFHGATGPYVRRELERVAAPTPAHRSWVAVGPDGDVHGTATLAWSRSGDVHAAFLVEDAWFRRGIGRSLYRALAREAVAARLPVVTATVLADNDPALRFLRAMAPDARPQFVGGAEVEVHLPVWPVASGPAVSAPAASAPVKSTALPPPSRAAASPRRVRTGEAA